MKTLLIILLLSCRATLPVDVGTGHVHKRNDTIQVCYTNYIAVWKVKERKRGVYYLEPIYAKKVLIEGMLEDSGNLVLYRYSYIKRERQENVFIYFRK